MDGPVYLKEPLMAFVRWRNGDDQSMRPFGPKDPEHPTAGKICQACMKPMGVGCYTTLLALGPGDNLEQQQKCTAGRYFRAVAIELHWRCATGLPDPV